MSSLVHRSHGVARDGGIETHQSPLSKKRASKKLRTPPQSCVLLFAVAGMMLYLILLPKRDLINDNVEGISWNFPLLTANEPSTRRERRYPLVIQSPDLTTASSLANEQDPEHLITKRRNKYWLNHIDRVGEGWNNVKQWPPEGCEPLADWQMGDNMNCNTFHEQAMNDDWYTKDNATLTTTRYIRDGGFRIAWMTTEYDGTRRVLKTLRYIEKRYFDKDNLERHRKDAIAAEQLTFSPYIANSFGHCAQSSLVDYSDRVSLYYIFKDKHNPPPTLDELFQISYDIVASVADTHHFNKDGRATITHMDIKPNQWIYINGKYVLNDFNICKFLSWNPEKNQHCGHASGYSGGRWQSPEQYTREAPLSEKADVYSLGNILYYLLTNGTKPFHNLSSSKAFRHVGHGHRLEIEDPAILNSTHPFHKHVRHAMDMCLEIDPFKRPDARKVREYLEPKLQEFLKSKERASVKGKEG